MNRHEEAASELGTASDETLNSNVPLLSRRRFILRLLLGLLLAAGMVAGWSAMGRQKSRTQWEAQQAILTAGGRVYLDYQWRDGRLIEDGRPQQLVWVRRLVGPKNLDRVVAVDLRAAKQLDGVVSQLPRLPYLVDLDVRDTPLRDEMLAILGRLAGLQRLDLSGTAITDQGVAHLASLTALVSLDLARTRVSDESVETLLQLKQLKRLDLAGTQISSRQVQRLRARLPACRITEP